MTTTGRLQQILAQVRASLAAKAERPRAGATGRAASRPQSKQASATIDELQAHLASGLRHIDTGTTEGRRQARRVFLESVLLSEFGVLLANDPRFSDIVTGVQDSFESESELLSDLDSVLRDLSSQG